MNHRKILVGVLAVVGMIVAGLGVTPSGTATAQTTTRDAFLWPFTSTSPWNMPLGDGATFDTGAMTANLIDPQYGMNLNAERWSQPVYKAVDTDPVITMSEVDSSPRTFNFNANPVTMQPAQPPANQGGDANMHVVQSDGHTTFENWKVEWTGPTTATSGYTVQGDLWGDGLRGTRAYGGSALGGLIRKHEIAGRNIPHAIAFSLTGNQLKSGYVWPARSQDWNGTTTYAGQVPMGSLFAIPRTVDITTLGLNEDGLALARALQNYGGYATARGANDSISAEPGSDPTKVSAMRSQVALIKSKLQVVTNNSQLTPGGPGNRMASLAPEIAGTTPPLSSTAPPTTTSASPPPTSTTTTVTKSKPTKTSR